MNTVAFVLVAFVVSGLLGAGVFEMGRRHGRAEAYRVGWMTGVHDAFERVQRELGRYWPDIIKSVNKDN